MQCYQLGGRLAVTVRWLRRSVDRVYCGADEVPDHRARRRTLSTGLSEHPGTGTARSELPDVLGQRDARSADILERPQAGVLDAVGCREASSLNSLRQAG